MAIVKMKRLRLIVLDSQKNDLLASLLRVGCVEVTETGDKLNDREWSDLMYKESSDAGAIRLKANQLANAMSSLKQYAKIKSGLLQARPIVAEADFLNDDSLAEAMQVSSVINDCSYKISQLFNQENRLFSQKSSFEPWKELDLLLEKCETENTSIILGVVPASVDVSAAAAAMREQASLSEIIEINADKEQHYLLLIMHKSEAEQALQALRPVSFSPINFKGMKGTPAENITDLEAQINELETKRLEEGEKIASYAEYWPLLKQSQDRLKQEINKQQVREHFLTDGTVVFLEGWVPAPDVEKLQEELTDYTCAIELSDPAEGDTPPTELRNSKLIGSMQMVTEMYSLPAYNGIDPNPLIFFFFTMFFGMMFGDMAYGIILIVLSQIVIHKIHPKGTFGNILQLATICGVTSFFWGALSGGMFGDVYSVVMEVFFDRPGEVMYVPVLDPLGNPMQVLYLAIIMGAVHLVTGQIIRIYMGFRDKEPWEGILDVVPWWILFAGIGMIVLNGSFWLLIAGVLALILTQGRHKKGIIGKLGGGIASLYDITSWLGDVLSYARLMALMLATTVIASVVNILGTLAGSVVVFVLVFIIGHTFNIGINIIGTYVHAARLQYLEYFSKFYRDGGIPFEPLRYDTKHVDVVPDKEVKADV